MPITDTIRQMITNDLRACYTKEDLKYMYTTTNRQEYKHLLSAYNITEEQLKEIIADML